MKTNRKLRLQLMMQNSFFVLLFLVLIFLVGFLSREYHYSKDVTQSTRNTLTEGSINVLKQMEGPVNMRVFVSQDEQYRKTINDFVSRYQRAKPDINIKFINPAEEPKLAQEAGIKAEGEVLVEYQQREDRLVPPYVEQDMTNLLVRLSRTKERAVMYLDGHGERNLIGLKNHDIGEFGTQLEKKGFKLANPDLTLVQEVPSNGAMLVIASPQVDISEIEVAKIKDYIEKGGNLLWLLDDENLRGLEPIAEYLGLQITPGVVIDLSSSQYGADPKVAFANTYGEHAITKNFMLRTLFPEARMIDAADSFEFGWKVSRLVEVAQNGWLETGKVEADAKAAFNDKTDIRGPINIAVALEREYGKKGQRVVVVGNGNFLANTFIGNGGNLDFGVNIVNWLAGDDDLITILPKPLKDVNVVIPSDPWNRFLTMLIFFGFRLVLPIVLLVAGVVIWWKRRKA
ncbi:MAG: ABC transporter [Betaproteobacteria bacterium HGW-Betaproteobacteria-8]|nr:MAG: ABC transporter [Betaproteobacteria bacterium HGW-Betaproteobacteria-8]